jgi:ribose-phosphate pyrophosphokinase
MGKIISLFIIGICIFSNLLTANEMMLFTGNSNYELGQKVSQYLQIPLASGKIDTFNDGEIHIHIDESIRGKDVFILQSTCQNTDRSVNDNLMELYLLIRTAKRASAASITAVIPYYGYARQDRKTTSRVPISAADVALMIETAGIDRVITIDLHCGQIQGFFRDVPVDNLFASSLFVSYIESKKLDKIVIVSPDAGGVERAKKFSDALRKKGIESEMALISKQRAAPGVVASMNLIGSVRGSNAIMIDDMCDTGGTLIKAAQLLKEEGADQVFALITHSVFSSSALDKIKNSAIDEMVVADTIPLRGEKPSNIHVLSVAPLIGEAILCIQHGESISALFE